MLYIIFIASFTSFGLIFIGILGLISEAIIKKQEANARKSKLKQQREVRYICQK